MTDAPGRGAIETWLRELGARPGRPSVREGALSWDLRVAGRRRAAIPITVILAPGLGCVVWSAFAPPLRDSPRKHYRRLLRWNEEYPFVKFGLTDDERPVLSVEVPMGELDRDRLGEALARCVAVCDALFTETSAWLSDEPAPAAPPWSASGLLDRYADRLQELLAP